ncbi:MULTISPECIES: hypothetical protein [unclassified Pseudomonas]|uniref:hypothetical protein n=1 Tax=unclassified Pseudomonas TaxID=196821 RepID=UPI0025810C6F|nr:MULTISPECIES: hypothetical protein [unclassified Pseudomonas]
MATSPSATLTPKTPRVFRGVLYANLVYLLILAGALALQSAVGKPVIAAGLLLAVFLIFLPASIMIGAGVRAAYATRSGKILFLTITVLMSVLLAQDMIPDEALRMIAWCWIGVGQPVMLLSLIARVISRSKAPRKARGSSGCRVRPTSDLSYERNPADDYSKKMLMDMRYAYYLHERAVHDTRLSDPATPPPVLPY